MIVENRIDDFLGAEKANLTEAADPSRKGLPGENKSLHMKGTFIQGAVRNQNGRVYPPKEIMRAVEDMNTRIKKDGPIPGEADHPDNLNQNIDRISHIITEMDMQGNDGIGKLKVLDSMPMGRLVHTLVKEGVKLGVSSRGSGDVNESNGEVKNFGIVTVDVVINPSAPNAFPKTIYEQMMNSRGGSILYGKAADAAHNPGSATAQKAFMESNELINLIRDIDLTTL